MYMAHAPKCMCTTTKSWSDICFYPVGDVMEFHQTTLMKIHTSHLNNCLPQQADSGWVKDLSERKLLFLFCSDMAKYSIILNF